MDPLLCFSHLRWDFVFQRPQHLMTRAALQRRVVYVEEPVVDGTHALDARQSDRVTIVTPHVRASSTADPETRSLLDIYLARQPLARPVLWYYTPAAVPLTRHLAGGVTVYDCMDELSAFRGARADMRDLERELLDRADLVFTGGQTLYEAKRGLHPSVRAFPSSVDTPHFARARAGLEDPGDQRGIRRPRVGFFGVLDERLDQELLAGLADARPAWQIVMVGPTVKIDPRELPRRDNIHYRGQRAYADLPSYISGWDVAWMPFARNEATRFISPTKTLEYMAAGRPVVSTSIQDVVRPYGAQGLVRIADTVDETVQAMEASLREPAAGRVARFDALLATRSWDATWDEMTRLISETAEAAGEEAA